MSILDLINKSKGSKDETAIKKQTNSISNKPLNQIPSAPAITKPKPFKLGIGVAKTKPVSTDEKRTNSILNKVSSNSPIKELASVVQNNSVLSENSISSILGDISMEITPNPETANAEGITAPQTSQSIQQNTSKSPTLDDLSKFVFDEQPDESTEEIALKFSSMLDGLLLAVGSDIPTVLSDTLKFMKEHAFLATILKPEEIGKLVKTMAKSYGYVVTNQAQKSTKRKAKSKEQNDILNSLDNLSF